MRVYSPAGKLFLAGVSLLFFGGCAVGPRYSRPSTPVPPAFKEVPQGWKQAHPSDQVLRGKWWEIFQDPELNALEEQINVSNQTLRAAQAQRSEEHTSELQSPDHLVCRLLLEKKKKKARQNN